MDQLSFLKNELTSGFPVGSLVKNPPANAGVLGSIPDPGRAPRAAKQLRMCNTTADPGL